MFCDDDDDDAAAAAADDDHHQHHRHHRHHHQMMTMVLMLILVMLIYMISTIVLTAAMCGNKDDAKQRLPRCRERPADSHEQNLIYFPRQKALKQTNTTSKKTEEFLKVLGTIWVGLSDYC